MELPDDVLVLIREYAKPVCTHFREYKEAIRMLEYGFVTYHTHHLNNLKHRLNEPIVRQQLKECLHAYECYQILRDFYYIKPDIEDLGLADQIDQVFGWVYVSMTEFVALID